MKPVSETYHTFPLCLLQQRLFTDDDDDLYIDEVPKTGTAALEIHGQTVET